jgi:TRAP transporter TAXI family solute receptor
MANEWNKYVPEVDITVVATPGSMANYIPMEKGEMDLGVASNIGNYWAALGVQFTKTKLSNFTTMLPISKNFTHFITYADSPMKTFKDLEGKNLLLGPKASTGAFVAEETFKAMGMTAKFIYSTQAEAVDMMKDRRADGMVYSVAAPWSSIMDIATSRPLKLLSMPPEELKKVSEILPWNIPDTIPTKTYTFQNEDTKTVSTTGCVNVRPDVSEEIVYKLTKVAWERSRELVKGMESLKWVNPRDILNQNAPIHPGAAKYYREAGIQIPDQMIWKKK